MALDKDLPHLKPEDSLFYRGNPPKNGKPSKFQNQPIGDKYLKNVPREMAIFLGLKNPERYKSHTMRHTAACFAAENGATIPQMMVS